MWVMSQPSVSLPKRAFVKTLCVFLVVMLLVSAAIALAGLSISTRFTLESTNTMKQDMLEVYQQEVENKLTNLSQQVNLFLLDSEVWELIYSRTDKRDYILIRNVLQKVKSKYYMDALVESVYFFDQAHDYVLADAYYHKEDFYDSIALTQAFADSTPVSDTRFVQGKEIFSIIYRPLTTSGGNPVTIVVNIAVSMLAEILPFSERVGDFVMINSRGSVIYASQTNIPLESLIKQANDMNDSIGIVTGNSRKYLAVKTGNSVLGTELMIFQDYESATFAEAMLRSMILPVISLVIIGAVVLTIIATCYLYHPLKELVARVSRIPSADKEEKASNEYALIDQVVDHLITKKNEMEIKYQEASSYQDSYYLQEFLISPFFNRIDFETMLKRRGVSFDLPAYFLLVIDLHNQTQEAIQRVILPPAELYPTSVRIIANQIDRERVAIIFNTEISWEFPGEMLLIIKQWFNDQGWDACLYRSTVFTDLSELPMVYNTCDKMLEQKFFYGYNIIVNEQVKVMGGTALLDDRWENELIGAVKTADGQKAHEILDSIISRLNVSGLPDAVDFVKFKLVQICVNIMSSMFNSTYDLQDIVTSPSYDIFRRLRKGKTIQDVKSELNNIVDLTVARIAQLTRHRNFKLVQRAVAFIGENLTRDISLDDISSSVYLTSNYFCGVFKAEMNMTVMDYITHKRIELACQHLLEHPKMQIKDLSTLLGYNSVQSFIRQFKKIMNTTPEQYRKENMQ